MSLPITNPCLPDECRLEAKHTIEIFPEGNYRDREELRISAEYPERDFDDEVRKTVAMRTASESWVPLVHRLLDGWGLEIRRVVVA